MIWSYDDERDYRRTLGVRDRQILYRNAKGICQNPGCGRKIDYDEMEIGHKTAWSRGGSTTFKNSLCLCHRCNKLQGTDSWIVFMKKQDIETPEMKALHAKTQVKQKLADLTLPQLKLLAAKDKVKPSGYIEEGLFTSRRLAPTKADYVKKLAGVVSDADIRSLYEPEPKVKAVTKKPATKKARK